MKLARVRAGSQVLLAQIDGDAVRPLLVDTGEPWSDPLRSWLHQDRPASTVEALSLRSVELLAPLRSPSKIVAVGLNYRDHAMEQKRDLPSAPMLFTKAPSAIIGPNASIEFSVSASQKVDYENELAVVMGRQARNVSQTDALQYVLGYTICNDVSARDAQRADGQFFRAKSFDTFCPLGPYVVTTADIPDPQKLSVRTMVNGETRQDGTTADMIFGVAETIAYVSTYMTLEPGDIISTGTPAGVGEAQGLFLSDGDVVTCEIDGLGILENPVRTY